jgi:hypothetical protein
MFIRVRNRLPIMLLILSALPVGCARRGDGPPPPPRRLGGEPIGVQMMRVEPHLKTQRFNTLVSFEQRGDAVFVTPAAGGTVEPSAAQAHTGRASLRTAAEQFTIKLSSLLPPGGAFPGKWSLAGGYLYAPDGAQVTLALHVGSSVVAQRKLTVPNGRWTPAMVDLTALGESASPPKGAAALVAQVRSSSGVFLDDVVLVENAQTIFEPAGDDATRDRSFGGPWTIRRAGLNYVLDAPGRFTTKLLSAEAGGAEGWEPEETCVKRARFRSGGTPKAATIYSDGRAYWDGVYRPLSSAAADRLYAQQHVTPARVEVAEEFGRVDRNTPGDADNDGYNEHRGAYQFVASGPRLEIGLTPRAGPLLRPVFEVRGLPPGKVLVTVEGRLIEDVTRLEDGTLLIDIPARVNRATTLYVKLQ